MTIAVTLKRPLSPLMEDSQAPDPKRRKLHHWLELAHFPGKPVSYKTTEEIDADDITYTRMELLDTQTQKTFAAYLKNFEIADLGISITVIRKAPNHLPALLPFASETMDALKAAEPLVAKHLTPQHKIFISQDAIPYVTRMISIASFLFSSPVRFSTKKNLLPTGICISNDIQKNVFLDLKKTTFGKGAFCKIKKAFWLNQRKVVVRKILSFNVLNPDSLHKPEKEQVALELFRNQRGIISLISAGLYNDKWTVFLPHYQMDFWRYLHQPYFSFSLQEQLDIASQWLDGLDSISKRGIHGDITPANLLLDPNAVIADLGGFRLYGQEEYGITCASSRSPEYQLQHNVTSKQDVWAMGLCLYCLFTKNCDVPFIKLTNREITPWLTSLKSDWILAYPWPDNTPPFIKTLINEMLGPSPIKRLTAQQAFEQFSKGRLLNIF